jgi:fatty acid desaturase
MVEISTNLLYNLYYFILLFNGILLLYTMITWHELGHLIYFYFEKKNKVKVYYNKGTFEVGTDSDYDYLSDEEHKVMLAYGVFIGFIPYIILIIFNSFYMFMFIPYLYGCRSDLSQLDFKDN